MSCLDLKVFSSFEDLIDREFQNFGPAIEKALLPFSVLVLGTFSNELANHVE